MCQRQRGRTDRRRGCSAQRRHGEDGHAQEHCRLGQRIGTLRRRRADQVQAACERPLGVDRSGNGAHATVSMMHSPTTTAIRRGLGGEATASCGLPALVASLSARAPGRPRRPRRPRRPCRWCNARCPCRRISSSRTSDTDHVELKLKPSRRDGTTHLVMLPQQIIQQPTEGPVCGALFVACMSAVGGDGEVRASKTCRSRPGRPRGCCRRRRRTGNLGHLQALATDNSMASRWNGFKRGRQALRQVSAHPGWPGSRRVGR
jgi:hypothetical protein